MEIRIIRFPHSSPLLALVKEDQNSISFTTRDAEAVLQNLQHIVEFVHQYGDREVIEELKSKLLIDGHEGLFALEGI